MIRSAFASWVAEPRPKLTLSITHPGEGKNVLRNRPIRTVEPVDAPNDSTMRCLVNVQLTTPNPSAATIARHIRNTAIHNLPRTGFPDSPEVVLTPYLTSKTRIHCKLFPKTFGSSWPAKSSTYAMSAREGKDRTYGSLEARTANEGRVVSGGNRRQPHCRLPHW